MLTHRVGAVLITLLILALVMSAGAADFQVGVEAYRRGEFAVALREWRPLAEQGDAPAQRSLGIMYDFGKGVSEYDAEAVKWYRKAAVQGYARGQYKLGLMYAAGAGVPQNYVQAYAWFNIAAVQNIEYGKTAKDILTKNMTPADISAAQRLAREYWEKYVLPFRN